MLHLLAYVHRAVLHRSLLHRGCQVLSHNPAKRDDNSLDGLRRLAGKPPDSGCECYVISTGFHTAQGCLLRDLFQTKSSDGVNTAETFAFILILLCFAVLSCAIVVTEGLKDDQRNRFKLLLHSIMIITSVVPPELPMELSLAVTNSLKSLSQRLVFCTEPPRMSLAGKLDTCCFDKTGTLTSDEVIVKGLRLQQQEHGKSAQFSKLLDPTSSDLRTEAVKVMSCCHSVSLSPSSLDLIGDPMEKSILSSVPYTLKTSESIVPIPAPTSSSTPTPGPSFSIVHRFLFDSKLKRMSVVAKEDGGKQAMFLVSKGAPEKMVQFFKKGSVPADYNEVSRYHMCKGHRVLAMGYKELSPELGSSQINSSSRPTIEAEQLFCGFIILTCPLKDDTVNVITELRESGHHCIMITGDAVLTAAEVARKVGIVGPGKTLELKKCGSSSFAWFRTDAENGSEEEDPIPHQVGDEAFLERLTAKGSGCDLCIGGDVMAQLLRGGDDGEGAAKADPDSGKRRILEGIVAFVKVFARHTPSQKEAVISALNAIGRFTLMCGDGTNDVGALKRAHVGISLISVPEIEKKKRTAMAQIDLIAKSEKLKRKLAKAKEKGSEDKVRDLQRQLAKTQKKTQGQQGGLRQQLKLMSEAEADVMRVSLGDASVAAPFTHRGTSIGCCKAIILQGRCTLVTMLQIYKILGVNCLVTALTLSKLTILGAKQGDSQMTAMGIVIAALFFMISLSKPLDKLSVERPSTSVLSFSALLSIAVQFAVHFAFISLAAAIAIPHLDPYNTSNIPDAPFAPTPLNSAVFLVNMCIFTNTFIVNYVGHPFTQSIRENRFLYNGLIVVAICIFTCTTEIFLPLNQLLQIDPFPLEVKGTALSNPIVKGLLDSVMEAVGFNGALGLIMIADTLAVNLLVRVIKNI